MPPTELERVSLRCCGSAHEIRFDHDDAPVLPMNVFRTNLICPVCDALLIVTLTLKSGGERAVNQEVI